MEQNEGNEFIEFSLIAVLVSVGVALMLNGASQQITNMWNMVAAFVIK
jgi:Flp pilus assembly pilin Flp